MKYEEYLYQVIADAIEFARSTGGNQKAVAIEAAAAYAAALKTACDPSPTKIPNLDQPEAQDSDELLSTQNELKRVAERLSEIVRQAVIEARSFSHSGNPDSINLAQSRSEASAPHRIDKSQPRSGAGTKWPGIPGYQSNEISQKHSDDCSDLVRCIRSLDDDLLIQLLKRILSRQPHE